MLGTLQTHPLAGAPSFISGLLLDQPDVPVANWVAVILQVDRAWGGTNIDRGCGRFAIRQFDVVVDFDSIVPNGHPSVRFQLLVLVVFCRGEVNVVGLPG